ncbi:unnamed protein product [Haemonchus placei]|uniref:Uncharacterized protein n=1 Tax=Haemonchus placei TaxID=6290 RepID=A0A3P7W579_HAEPC|nr:unnamed protein product [Haemonchus placei]
MSSEGTADSDEVAAGCRKLRARHNCSSWLSFFC